MKQTGQLDPDTSADGTDPTSLNRMGEPALLGIIAALLRYRVVVAGLSLTLALITGAYALLQPRLYTSDASFIPQQARSSLGGVSGLASQFGLSGPGMDQTQSPTFYASLLKSREILRDAVLTIYTLPVSQNAKPRSTLVELYSPGDGPSATRITKAIDRLNSVITTTVTPRTGVVRVSIMSPSAQLSQQIALRLLDLVTKFNLETRRSQAAAERRFTQQRLDEVGAQLRAAEDRLQSFLETNREFAGSAVLRFQQDRLAREVALQQALYSTLAQSFEQAKIEEVRDTPVITVVEQPNLAVAPNGRGVVRLTLVGGLVGLFLGGLFALACDFFPVSRLLQRGSDGGYL